MPVSFKSVLSNCVKIVAGTAAALGIYIIYAKLVPSFIAPMTEGVVSAKSVDSGGIYCIHYHTPKKPGEDLHCYFSRPESFYEEARVADVLQMEKIEHPLEYGQEAYRRLVRDGCVVARAFSTQQQEWIVFTIAMFLPSVIFIPCKNKSLKKVLWVVAISVEITGIIVLIGIALMFGFIHLIMSDYHEGGRP